MIEMLLKSLGITPEEIKQHIDHFRKMADNYEARLNALEKNVSAIAAALNVQIEKENSDG